MAGDQGAGVEQGRVAAGTSLGAEETGLVEARSRSVQKR